MNLQILLLIYNFNDFWSLLSILDSLHFLQQKAVWLRLRLGFQRAVCLVLFHIPTSPPLHTTWTCKDALKNWITLNAEITRWVSEITRWTDVNWWAVDDNNPSRAKVEQSPSWPQLQWLARSIMLASNLKSDLVLVNDIFEVRVCVCVFISMGFC